MKARDVAGLDPAAALRPNAEAIVQKRFEELQGFAGEALAPEAGKAQHEMRIAAKRLRYVLEVFAPCLDAQAKEVQQAAKRLQSLLGDLHDCDLMLPKLERIPSAARLLHERRAHLFREFVEAWDDTPIFHA